MLSAAQSQHLAWRSQSTTLGNDADELLRLRAAQHGKVFLKALLTGSVANS